MEVVVAVVLDVTVFVTEEVIVTVVVLVVAVVVVVGTVAAISANSTVISVVASLPASVAEILYVPYGVVADTAAGQTITVTLYAPVLSVVPCAKPIRLSDGLYT
tara:strand:- start:719 stop:1030 length:312 start_codon:yes stop_codon:yes gene_type:complete